MKKFTFKRWFQCIGIPCVDLYFRMYYGGIKVKGRENIPEGGCVVCANHCQLSDPPLVAVGLTIKYPIAVMAKKELFEGNVIFNWIISALGAFPVDRGRADISAIKTALKSVKDGKKLIIFPEGTRKQEDEDVGAKEGAAMLAYKTKAQILPVYISENKQKSSKVNIVIGKPFYPEIDAKQPDAYKIVSEDILKRVYALKEEI